MNLPGRTDFWSISARTGLGLITKLLWVLYLVGFYYIATLQFYQKISFPLKNLTACFLALSWHTIWKPLLHKTHLTKPSYNFKKAVPAPIYDKCFDNYNNLWTHLSQEQTVQKLSEGTTYNSTHCFISLFQQHISLSPPSLTFALNIKVYIYLEWLYNICYFPTNCENKSIV